MPNVEDALAAEAVDRIISATETTATGKRADCRGSLVNRQRLAADLGRLQTEYAIRSLDDNRPTVAQITRKIDTLRQAASRLRKASAGIMNETNLLQAAAAAHFADLNKAAASGDHGASDMLMLLAPLVEFHEQDEDGECFIDVRVEQAVRLAHGLSVALEHWCHETREYDENARPDERAHQLFADETRALFRLHFGSDATAGLGASGTEPSPAIRFALAVFAEIKSAKEQMLSASQLSERWRQRP